jgi:hypothetical protein
MYLILFRGRTGYQQTSAIKYKQTNPPGVLAFT